MHVYEMWPFTTTGIRIVARVAESDITHHTGTPSSLYLQPLVWSVPYMMHAY